MKHAAAWFAILLALTAGLIWSWGTWPDVIVDGGRELYVPWRLTAGDVLYRDLRTFNGPLSPYLQAAWFSVWGVSLRSLAIMNLLIILGVLGLLYHLLLRLAGYGSAVLGCLTFVGLFAFAQLEPIGCANWMFPYSHEVTHGVALALAMVACLTQWLRGGRAWWATLGGLCLGLVFLTKAEVFLAAACAAGAMLGGAWLLRRRSAAALAGFTVAALLPAAISVIAFSRVMPLSKAVFCTAGTWPYVFHAEHRDNMFFKWCMGTLDTADSLRRLGLSLLVYGGLAALGLAISRWRQPRAAVAAALLSGLALTALVRSGVVDMSDFALPWQLFVAAAGLWAAWRLWQQRGASADPASAALLVGSLGLIVLALALLAKILLYVRVWQYGFGLAMPAAMVVLAAAWDWLPAWLQRRGLQSSAWRGAVLGAWAVVLVVHLALCQRYFAGKTFAVGEGPDRFWSDARGSYVEHARGVLQVSMQPGQTLTVMPEGVMLNYLLRSPGATPDNHFTLPVVVLYGEQTMLSSLRSHPPSWLVLIHQDGSGYGARFFGRDFAIELGRWAREQYVFAAPIGAPPFQDRRFGIVIGKRKDLLPANGSAQR